jgi:cytochrome b involved in lipid metabolism
MKKIILIIAVLVIVGGLYWANTRTKDSTLESATSTQSVKTPNSENIPATSPVTYKLEEIAKHNKSGDCWTTVNGKVYDLTTWPDKHPGGDKAIFAICGIDGTTAYEKAHKGQEKPAGVLDGFLIGNLVK